MKKGFTLIEVVFAVGIIIMFLGSLVAIFNVGAKNILVSKHRLQAANLAREGAELMRQTRDSSWLNNQSWNVNFASKATTLSAPISPINSVTYSRTVSVTYPATSNCPAASCAKVTSAVTWSDFGQAPHNVTTIIYLTNWKT